MSQQVRIKASPHTGQAEVHNSPARWRVLGAGRRWGKTRLGVNECLDCASKGGRAWWVAPSYKMSEVGWRPIRQMAAKIGAEIRRVDRQIILSNGGEIAVRSADNPDSLRGESLDLVVIDEAAFVKEDAWNEALRPALSDRKGRAIFISTPKGRNWFWHAYQRGLEPGGEWQSWQLPTVSNPFIDPDEVEAARQSLPERIFRQEYLAEFIDDNDAVFRRVMDAAIAGQVDEAQPGRDYVLGVDWGKLADYSVITVLDDTGAVVAVDRFNKIDYTFQVERLKALAARFKPHNIIAESNSMGEPLIEMLQRENLPVSPFQTTNASKKSAIEALALAFERGDITIPNDPVLIGELQAFEASRLPSGLIRYAAPDGMHDDMVMSLAMAWQGRETGGLILFGA
jgi:phage terminase large subunit-like protein